VIPTGFVFWGAIAYGGWRILRPLPVLMQINGALRRLRTLAAVVEPDSSGLAMIKVVLALVVAAFVIAVVLDSQAGETNEPTTTYPVSAPVQAAAPSVQRQFTDPGVTKPQPGSKDRVGMMNAARTYLGTTAQFYVHDIAVRGNLGVADSHPYPGDESQRVRLTFERSGAAWVCVGQL